MGFQAGQRLVQMPGPLALGRTTELLDGLGGQRGQGVAFGVVGGVAGRLTEALPDPR